MSGLARFVRVSDRVAATLASRQPCVALESTIITHGLPYPANLETAIACEDAVVQAGAMPATIALLDGIAHIGLERPQLERLAQVSTSPASTSTKVSPSQLIKASRRDLAHVLSLGKGAIGGTTVSGTMALSHLAGIPIFATGGIGGVHRGAQSTMDISADLTELSRTPVSVFCSGAKSILDLPLTLEYLETAGVTVASFHPCGRFPAFYSQDSGLTVNKIRDVSHAANLILASQALGLQNGIVFAVPIPDSHAPAAAEIQGAVEQAVRESVEQGIDKRGKEVTPWLLARISQLTSRALESNKALVINNARVAARTACRVHQMQGDEGAAASSAQSITTTPAALLNDPLLSIGSSNGRTKTAALVVGSAAVDISAQSQKCSKETALSTTYPGRIHLFAGGVARNMAEAAARLLRARRSEFPTTADSASSSVKLVAPIAEDPFGTFLLDTAREAGVRRDGFFVAKSVDNTSGALLEEQVHSPRTAVCSLTLNADGDLIHGVADFDIAGFYGAVKPVSAVLEKEKLRFRRHLSRALDDVLDNDRAEGRWISQTVIAMDANLGPDILCQVITQTEPSLARPHRRRPTLLFEPTSLPKCVAILEAVQQSRLSAPSSGTRSAVDIITPNLLELLHLHSAARSMGLLDGVPATRGIHSPLRMDVSQDVLQALVELSSLFEWIFLKRGGHGVLVARRKTAIAPVSAAEDGRTPVPTLQISEHAAPVTLGEGDVVSTTGAGDTFAGALVAACSSLGPPSTWTDQQLRKVVDWAQRAAARTVLSSAAVAPDLCDLPFPVELAQ